MAWKDFFNRNRARDEMEADEALDKTLLQEDQQERFDQDVSILDDLDGSREHRLQKEAEREVQTAAANSIKKLHVIQMGRCPVCGEHLRQHLFASICEACGWHTFDVPRQGPVRIHLRGQEPPVEGERCYVIKSGAVLVLKNDLVVAKIPPASYTHIEYMWSDDEVDQRHRNVVERLGIACGWCNKPADPNGDGFHMVHAAFGTSQERYCFCSDECYEAFRKMYPARVHRDCYNRNCVECSLCSKRYGDEAEGIRMLAKDFLSFGRKKEKDQGKGGRGA